MPRRLLALVALVLVAGLLGTGAPRFSSAVFTASSTSTATVQAATDWTPPTVHLRSPGSTARGSVALSADAEDAESGVETVVLQVRAGDGDWRAVCTAVAAPYTCSWDTTETRDGTYDLRAQATDRAGYSASSESARSTVDNQAPAVTMTDPGSPLRGAHTFAATASDEHSGIASVTLQFAPRGSSGWTELCTIAQAPFTCRVDTALTPDGTYALRAVATDAAGNSTASAVVADRVVANTVSTITVQDPGAVLHGSVPLRADASSTAGVTRVRIQGAPAGTSQWTDVCTQSHHPYTCTVDTTQLPDGAYDLRAVLVDGTGTETVSEVVGNRRVDNTPLQGHDIQAVNGGGTAGRPDAGDAVTFTWTGVVDLTTVRPGWSGGPVPVQVRLRDGRDVGGSKKDDVLDVQSTSGVVRLGSVALGEDYVKSDRVAVLNGTMKASTLTVAGKPATLVTVVLGSAVRGGEELHTRTKGARMTWSPASAVRDESGRPVSTQVVTESGGTDRNF